MKNILKNKTIKGIIIAVFLIIVLILLFLNKSEIYQPKTEKGLLNLLSQSGSAKGGNTVTTTPTPSPTPTPTPEPMPDPEPESELPPDPEPTPTPPPSTSVTTPFIRGKVITPGYRTDWEKDLLRAPLFGQIQLEWNATSVNRLFNLYTSDCQIRRVNQNGEMREILVDKVGLSGTATVYVNHQNPFIVFARKSEGYLYGVYCRFTNSDHYGLVTNKLLDTDIYQTEVSFDSIVASLRANKITKITENDFRSWASDDEYDHCEYQYKESKCARSETLSPNPSILELPLFRSGDKEDIMGAMATAQIFDRLLGLPQFPKIDPSLNLQTEEFKRILKLNDKNRPAGFGEQRVNMLSLDPVDYNYYFPDPDTCGDHCEDFLTKEAYDLALKQHEEDGLPVLFFSLGDFNSAHKTIALKTIISKKGENEFFDEYTIELLDSNYATDDSSSGIRRVNCMNKQVNVLFYYDSESDYSNYEGIGTPHFYSEYGFVCQKELVKNPLEVAYFITSSKYAPDEVLFDINFDFHCKENPQSKMCVERSDNMSLWLKNNYPLIENFGTEVKDGNCLGWVDFVLRTTYLGDFVGEGLHPQK